MSQGPESAPNAAGEFLLFHNENAQTRVQVLQIDGVLWLTQRQMAELYETSKQFLPPSKTSCTGQRMGIQRLS